MEQTSKRRYTATTAFYLTTGIVVVVLVLSSSFLTSFFFNDTATTEIYTLSLHDALPISVTTNLLKFMRASIKMIGVSNLQSFIASMTQKLTLSDISDESKNYLDKAGITTACLRIKSKWTAGGK